MPRRRNIDQAVESARQATPLNPPGGVRRDAEYLIARIARDRPDILDRLKAGEYPSIRKAALEAAANPADGKWYFFVAVNPITGETKYGETLAQHEANVRELDAYCAANPQDCGK